MGRATRWGAQCKGQKSYCQKSYWERVHGDVTVTRSPWIHPPKRSAWGSLAATIWGAPKMATMTVASAKSTGMSKDEKFVIFASSLGTVFEWYDFYLYATLAPFFAALFFPSGNDTAALLSAFATYAAGFLVRPFGALVFGRLGDMIGRKYTFLVTIMV